MTTTTQPTILTPVAIPAQFAAADLALWATFEASPAFDATTVTAGGAPALHLRAYDWLVVRQSPRPAEAVYVIVDTQSAQQLFVVTLGATTDGTIAQCTVLSNAPAFDEKIREWWERWHPTVSDDIIAAATAIGQALYGSAHAGA